MRRDSQRFTEGQAMSAQFVILVGYFSTGVRVIGPFPSREEASLKVPFMSSAHFEVVKITEPSQLFTAVPPGPPEDK